ncbi:MULTISPECIES: hypothetical protein [Streptomyces]|uniref:hypothetical protein n=1 Tax=Streptomyces TaxID=1883 RepID=UPI00103AA80A|nr:MULTISPECIES: hypothetical protein [Streptomyces]WTC69766.1 hypothetical protein OG882_05230 [Streptomyces anulatus]MBH0242072.1 hypothetical protein [Streptomyces cavourensis]MBT3077564.1 hypothetical protein [Streptomyces sp. COG21]MBT3084409.1 hypothetical protein [Streptomyces sp. COG20]MBT3086981.1 hypothetical protein [Streptomyces sp. CYG21]
MAAPTKPTLVLEKHYNVKQACDRLGLSDPEDPNDKRGQKWLRDGVNQEQDPFPCSRMARQLLFTEADLIEIARRHRNRAHGNRGPRRKRRLASAA